METLNSALARITLVAAFGIILIGQLSILPWFISDVLAQFPQMSPLARWYQLAVTLAFACGQLVLISIFALVKRADRNTIFEPGSLKWMDLTTTAITLATSLTAVLGWHSLIYTGVGGPGLGFFTLAALSAGFCLINLSLIARKLLRKSIILDQASGTSSARAA